MNPEKVKIITLWILIGVLCGLVLLIGEKKLQQQLHHDPFEFFLQRKEASFEVIQNKLGQIEKQLSDYLDLLKKSPLLEKDLSNKDAQIALFQFLENLQILPTESIKIVGENETPIAWKGWFVSENDRLPQKADTQSHCFFYKEKARTYVVLEIPFQNPFQTLKLQAALLVESNYPIKATFLEPISLQDSLQEQVELPFQFFHFFPNFGRGTPIWNQFGKQMTSVYFPFPLNEKEWKHFCVQEQERVSHHFFQYWVRFGLAMGALCFFLFLFWTPRSTLYYFGGIVLLWLLRLLALKCESFLFLDRPFHAASLFETSWATNFLSFSIFTRSLTDLTLTLFCLLFTWYFFKQWLVLQNPFESFATTKPRFGFFLLLAFLFLGGCFVIFERLVYVLVAHSQIIFFNPLKYLPDFPVFLAKFNLALASFLFFRIFFGIFDYFTLLLSRFFPKNTSFLELTFLFSTLLFSFAVFLHIHTLFFSFLANSFPHLYLLLFCCFLLHLLSRSPIKHLLWLFFFAFMLLFTYVQLNQALFSNLCERIEKHASSLEQSRAQQIHTLLEEEVRKLPSVSSQISFEAIPIQDLLEKLNQLKAEYQINLYQSTKSHHERNSILVDSFFSSQLPKDWFPQPASLDVPVSSKIQLHLGKRDLEFVVVSKRFVNAQNRVLGWVSIAVLQSSLTQSLEESNFPPLFVNRYQQGIRGYRSSGGFSPARISPEIQNEVKKKPFWRTIPFRKIDYQTYYFPKGEGGIYSISFALPQFEQHLIAFLRLGIAFFVLLILVALFRFFQNPRRHYTFQFNFTRRILLAFLVLSFIPLLFLARYQKNAATVSRERFFSEQINNVTKVTVRYLRKSGVIENASLTLANSPHQTLSVSQFFTAEICQEIQEITGFGLNIYLEGGEWIASNRPEYFEMQFFSTQMNPDAYLKSVLEKDSFFLTKEPLGNDAYIVGYRPFYDENRNLIGVVSIPRSLKDFDFFKNQITLYWRLTYLYLGLLLVLSVMSTLIARYLTKPMSFLLEGTRKLSEGDLNYEIPHHLKGEFGELLTSFNQMTKDLKESQDKLVDAEKRA